MSKRDSTDSYFPDYDRPKSRGLLFLLTFFLQLDFYLILPSLYFRIADENSDATNSIAEVGLVFACCAAGSLISIVLVVIFSQKIRPSLLVLFLVIISLAGNVVYILGESFIFIIMGRVLSSFSAGIIDIARREAVDADLSREIQPTSLYYKLSYFVPMALGTAIAALIYTLFDPSHTFTQRLFSLNIQISYMTIPAMINIVTLFIFGFLYWVMAPAISIKAPTKSGSLWPHKIPGPLVFLLLHNCGVQSIMYSLMVLIPPLGSVFFRWTTLEISYVFTLLTIMLNLSFFSGEVITRGIHGKTLLAISLFTLLAASIIAVVGLWRSYIVLMVAVALFSLSFGAHLSVMPSVMLLFVPCPQHDSLLTVSSLSGYLGAIIGSFWAGISFKGTKLTELPITIGFVVLTSASIITICLFFKRMDSAGYFERMGQSAQVPLLMTDAVEEDVFGD